jgi:phosphomannomutase
VDLEVTQQQKERAVAHFSDGHLSCILDWTVVRREDMDGIKVYLGEIGWVMVRASGTENVLRVYSETSKTETTRRVLSTVSQIVHEL